MKPAQKRRRERPGTSDASPKTGLRAIFSRQGLDAGETALFDAAAGLWKRLGAPR